MLSKIFGFGIHKKDQRSQSSNREDEEIIDDKQNSIVNSCNVTDKKEKNGFVMPMDGKLLELADVPDEVFARKIMGDGFAIEPVKGEVVSPVNGKINLMFPSKHAIGILSDDDLEILIHIGIDTVNLNGEGFEVLVEEGETVVSGQPLIRVDIEFIKNHAKSIITPVIFTNLREGQKLNFCAGIQVERGEPDVFSIQ